MKILVLAAIVVSVQLVPAIDPDSITQCNPEFCFLVDCMNMKPEQCDRRTEVFVKADNCRYCCDSCVKRRRPACDESFCATVRCAQITRKDCKRGQIFRPKGYKCGCCAYCEDIKATYPPCQRIDCRVVKCRSALPSECTADQIFLQADGKCRCCDQCVSIV